MKHDIVISIDTDSLRTYTDAFLATAWVVAQANPAPFGDRLACELAEGIGREIIARWLKAQPPVLWTRQGRHVTATTPDALRATNAQAAQAA